jgi:hypothetical protein
MMDGQAEACPFDLRFTGPEATLEYHFFGTTRADVPANRVTTTGDEINGSVPFDWDKATLTDGTRQIVAEAASTSIKVQRARIEVNGFTSRTARRRPRSASGGSAKRTCWYRQALVCMSRRIVASRSLCADCCPGGGSQESSRHKGLPST